MTRHVKIVRVPGMAGFSVQDSARPNFWKAVGGAALFPSDESKPMHPANAFRETDVGRLAAVVSERGFALIVADSKGRPMIAHAPVLLRQGRLRFHLSAANALTAVLSAGAQALVVVNGPDAYVSPDWYATADQVPTWNYVSVEIEGSVRLLSADETTGLLDDLSARFEADLAPKAPWTRAKMTPARFETLLKAICGFEMTVERFEGVSKLSQNKPTEVERVATALAAQPNKSAQAIARLMADRVPKR